MIKSITATFVGVMVAATLCACGGGGGTSLYGSSATASSTAASSAASSTGTVSLQLVDSTGTAINPPTLSGTQSVTVIVTALNASGAADAGKLVALSGEAVTFTPSSGQLLTDTSGKARFQIQSSDPFAGGATIIAAAVTGGGQGQLAVALGGASATVGAISTSGTSVGAYETIQVSVPVTLTGSTGSASQLPVTFSASCGAFDPAQAVTDSSGIAKSTYRNQSGTSACSGTVTLTAQINTASSTAQITAVAPAPANIQFVSATPGRIYLAGSPGVSQSIVTFKLVDSSGNAVSGQSVDLDLTLMPAGAYLGGTPGTTSMTQSTAADGTVAVAVNAGAAPGPVQIKATLVSVPSIKNVSNTLSVASGLPVQKAFSLSVSTFNIEALEEDGVETTITLRVADRLGNPVPDGTTVNLIAEGGQVVASCNTTGASSNATSACSAKLSSQAPRPTDGRVTVLAWAQGEETFADSGSPTNNVYDAGETFEDLGQPFLDKNENGVYDQGSDVAVGTSSGTSACPPGAFLSVPSTCNGVWSGILVRSQAVITFSGNKPSLATLNASVVRSALSSTRCEVDFVLKDVNGNPMPSGTTLAVNNISGGGSGSTPDATFLAFGGEGDKVPNTSNVARTSHSAVFDNCVSPAAVHFGLSITTPKGVQTTVLF